MEKFKLRMFFYELVKAGFHHSSPNDNPVSELVKSLILRPDRMVERIMGDFTGESNEYRLNGAGLKMYWKVRRDDVKPKFTVRIGGDQTNLYKDFVAEATRIINEYQFGRN